MSHRHSFNTRQRVRVRQMHALERWEGRIKHCAKMVNDYDESQDWARCSETAREQRDILKGKLGY